jgi:signal transduction histidine kinase
MIEASGWPLRAYRSARTHESAAIAGVLLAAAALAEALGRAAVIGASAQLAVTLVLLGLATTLPVALLRPTGAAVAVIAAGVISVAFLHSLTAAGFATQLIALYWLGRRDGLPVVVGTLTLPYLVLALVGPRPAATEAGILTVLLAGLGPAAAWSGMAMRARREAEAQSVAKESLAGTLSEHSARAERARIARELHDVVAHHISIVAVQAETARLATPGMPAAGAQRLSAIGDTARMALNDMRRLLGVLRDDVDVDAIAIRRPQPALGDLYDLLDAARDASNAGTRLILGGSRVVLDPTVELAAYRITQEALTNARRHAPGAAVDVELLYGDGILRLRIRDNGPGPSAAGPVEGLGLTGMRERAAAAGGHLRVGLATGGGFLVEATFPSGSVGAA